MKRYLTETEIGQAKADKKIRDGIMAEIEATLEIGKPRPVTVDGPDPETGYKMGVYRMTRRTATEDAIRQFCDAIGDFNPLYRNRDYVKNSRYGGIIAPAQFLGAIAPFSGIAKAMEDLDFRVARVDAGVNVEWFKIIREDDCFTVFEYPTSVKDITRENTALQFLINGNRVFKNQRDEVVAVVEIAGIAVVLKAPSTDAGQIGKPPQLRHFSEAEVEAWFEKAQAEKIRGADPRFWEDVNEGDEIPPTHHVFTMAEAFAYSAAMGKSASWRTQMAHSGGAWKNMLDPESGLPDFTHWHLTDAAAQRQGMERANCLGMQMRAWLGRMISNWMGDDGFIKKMGDQLRGVMYRESLALCKGKVVKKYVQNGEHLVDLAVTLEDHDGKFMIPNGSATVVLPSRRMESRLG
ncbi:MAG: MaoC family dehydratase N-terminal domain-containing protein [Deltaproteobacteria bacterium]|nr:MaoC family dehydratase N-terminal domain-containing protein [Deltaproteobacteria bacterium]